MMERPDSQRRADSGEALLREGAFPRGWEVTRLGARPLLPPLAKEELPPARSISVPKGRTVIVVNDARRPTPTPWLLGRLNLDWDRGNLAVAVATGSHPPPTEEELSEIFGAFLEKARPHLVLHHAGDGGLVPLGRTARGTPVDINPCLVGASSVICLGSVEPHYFAGWTGGRKSLVPGLCSMETMRANHRLALEETGPGVLEGNAVHLDLEEAVGLVDRRLGRERPCEVSALNVVTAAGLTYGWAHGPLPGLVENLASRGADIYGRRPGGTFPVVVCLVAPPLDRDLYQGLKAFENWKGAVSPGGTLILVAACREGMGPPSFRQFLESPPSLGDLLPRTAVEYRLGDHKLVNFLRYRESGRGVMLVSGELSLADGLPLQAFEDLEKALDAAGEGSGGDERRALVVEDAAHLYPLSVICDP
jgi:nickel-dependent lactate racemase